MDSWSKWVEAFPIGKADATTLAKILVNEIIPRWRIPVKIYSDYIGPHFCNKVTDVFSEWLGIDLRKHCAFHPQSAGPVERINSTIKDKLRKTMNHTGLNWVQCLLCFNVY